MTFLKSIGKDLHPLQRNVHITFLVGELPTSWEVAFHQQYQSIYMMNCILPSGIDCSVSGCSWLSAVFKCMYKLRGFEVNK